MGNMTWALLTKVYTRIEAEMIKAALKALDIPVELAQEGAGHWAIPLSFGDFAEVKLYGDLINSMDSRIEKKSSSFGLYQNFPNPFNPVTIINFTLPKSDRVYLKIFDMSGRLVKTLVNDYVQSGMHKIEWDSSSQSSGIYLCRLSSRGQTETRKMILLR